MGSRESRAGSVTVVLLGALLLSAPAPLRAAVAAIGVAVKVDQAGYLPTARKVAIVVAASPATAFSVKSQAGGAVAFQGTLGPQTQDVAILGQQFEAHHIVPDRQRLGPIGDRQANRTELGAERQRWCAADFGLRLDGEDHRRLPN